MNLQLTEEPHFLNQKEIPNTYYLYLDKTENAVCFLCDKNLNNNNAWFISYDEPYIPKKNLNKLIMEKRKIRVFSCIDHDRQGNADKKEETKIPLIMDKYPNHLCLFVKIIKD